MKKTWKKLKALDLSILIETICQQKPAQTFHIWKKEKIAHIF